MREEHWNCGGILLSVAAVTLAFIEVVTDSCVFAVGTDEIEEAFTEIVVTFVKYSFSAHCFK